MDERALKLIEHMIAGSSDDPDDAERALWEAGAEVSTEITRE